MTNKLGYGVQNKMTYGRNWSTDEETYHFDHLKRSQPGAMLYLDDDGKALKTKGLLPDCAVVGRLWRSDEGKLFEVMTPQQCFDAYKSTPKGVIRNILNEPGGYGDLKRIAHWCAQVMDLFGNAGIPIVAPNWGEGNPDVDRLADLEELWVAFDKWHDLHYYGTHEYGSHLGMLYNVAGKFDMTPWRVGRFESFIVPYLQKHGHKVPNVIVTEYGCDSAHDGTSFRGWTTCWDEARYFTELSAPIGRFYNAPHYKGLCIFSWGNTGQKDTQEDWITFDVSGAKGLHKLIETLNIPTPKPVTKPLPPAPVPPPVPPSPPQPVPAPIITTPGAILPISGFKVGDSVLVKYPGQYLNKVGKITSLDTVQEMYYVTISPTEGGMWLNLGQFEAAPIPPSTPGDDSPVDAIIFFSQQLKLRPSEMKILKAAGVDVERVLPAKPLDVVPTSLMIPTGG